MVDYKWTVVDFQKEVFFEIVMAEIAADAGTLTHPVEPDSSKSCVDAVVCNQTVDRRMDLNTSLFFAPEESLHMNVVDVIPGYFAEDGSETPHDPRLLAVVNVIIAYNVTADRVTCPAIR